MSEVNRMDDPVVPAAPDAINFLDPEIQECPYPAYSVLRDEAPIWRDPATGFYSVVRYDDMRSVLMDTENFGSERRQGEGRVHTEREKKDPEPLSGEGAGCRRRRWRGATTPTTARCATCSTSPSAPARSSCSTPSSRSSPTAWWTPSSTRGECDWVKQVAIPLPLIVIGKQMGVPESDIWQIKAWTDAWGSGSA